MRFLIILFVLFLSFFAKSQNVSIKKDSVLNDSNRYEIFYIITDTVGNIDEMDYYIKINKKDSLQIVEELFDQIKSSYDLYGKFEADKYNLLVKANKLRQLRQKITSVDSYRIEISDKVRKSMAGTYAIRYGQNIHRIDLQANGVARDAQGTLIMTHAPMSTTWTTVVYRIGEQENIQCYQIRPGVWLGDGSKGRLIMRKI